MKPAAVARVERLLDGRAASWELVVSRGYAVGERWIVRLDDRRSVFAKVGVLDWMVENMRAEMRVYAHVEAPFLPRLVAWDEGHPPLLVLEDLSGAVWPPPWDAALVDAVLSTLAHVARTPPPPGLPRLAEEDDRGWATVADDPQPFLSLGLASPAWLDVALPQLVTAEAAAPLDGAQLVHCDVRSDNLCVRDGRAVLFDWNSAHVGNPTFDVAFWLPSLVLEGGPPVDAVATRVPAVDAFASFVAGFFAARAGLEPPAGAPTVRGFQLAQLEVALPWAGRVLGLPTPDGG